MTVAITLPKLEAMVRRKRARVQHTTRRAGAAIADAKAARAELAEALDTLRKFTDDQNKAKESDGNQRDDVNSVAEGI